uniref:Phage protein n=1 Tax=Caenorhabditis tropicalis TaxID=1561998 RepID=A0A1I7T6G7_9PELO
MIIDINDFDDVILFADLQDQRITVDKKMEHFIEGGVVEFESGSSAIIRKDKWMMAVTTSSENRLLNIGVWTDIESIQYRLS